MNGRGDTSERRTFTVVMAVVLGTVLAMLLLQPGDDAQSALAAGKAVSDTREQADAGKQVEIATALPDSWFPSAQARVIERVLQREDTRLPPLIDERIAGWVNDLRDDHVRWNANHAMHALVALPAGDITELEAALRSFDGQQRHLAAAILRRRCRDQRASASADLLRVSVDALRNDLGPVARAYFSTCLGSPAVDSARFLRSRAAAAGSMLADQLTSMNPQQRFLSAYLLAQAGLAERKGYPGHAGRIAFELLGHLADNKISGDALMATHGLYRLGDAALPILLENRRFMDPQAQKLIDLIRLDLQQPPRNRKELRQRGRGRRISTLYHDAAIEYDMRKSVVPRFGVR